MEVLRCARDKYETNVGVRALAGLARSTPGLPAQYVREAAGAVARVADVLDRDVG